MSRYKRIDLGKVKVASIFDKLRKVDTSHMARVFSPPGDFLQFMESIPPVLKGVEIREIVEHWVNALEKGKSVILMMGSHVIKVGLSPLINDLIKNRYISLISLNGSGIIHDCELAVWGMTSENVDENLQNGTFGMSGEAAEFLNDAISTGKNEKLGLGEAVGKGIYESDAPNRDLSIVATAYSLGIPVTVHVAVGTDTIHQHPSTDPAAIGDLSYRDFKIFAEMLKGINGGGMVLNVGSAVILPEVFLKALTAARNVYGEISNFYTVNLDMIQHYRPLMNVVKRPVTGGGEGYSITGHHEIMVPLLCAYLKCRMEGGGG